MLIRVSKSRFRKPKLSVRYDLLEKRLRYVRLFFSGECWLFCLLSTRDTANGDQCD